MKKSQLIFLFILCIGSVSEAAYYANLLGTRLNLDYKYVRVGAEETQVTGNVELVGGGGGILVFAPGAFGYKAGLEILGTNSQTLNPQPGWGTPWYLRTQALGNYAFAFGLFIQGGFDLIGSFSQAAEHHYLGLGAVYGLGYRPNDRMSVSISSTNSSILFAVDNHRTARGPILEFAYSF